MHVSCAYDAFKNICWERLMNIQFSSCVHKNRRLHADALSKKTSLTLWDSDLTKNFPVINLSENRPIIPAHN